MTEPVKLPEFPPAWSVNDLYAYLGEHIAAGRGDYHPEVRSHYIAAPPGNLTHDASIRTVFIGGYY